MTAAMSIRDVQEAMSADYNRWMGRVAELADQAATAGDDWNEHAFRHYLESLEYLPKPWTLPWPDNPWPTGH
ncbi:hypothetical protein [Nocardia tenerifensis]|nr:hypothetical protein [Nocardia tenerifensis]